MNSAQNFDPDPMGMVPDPKTQKIILKETFKYVWAVLGHPHRAQEKIRRKGEPLTSIIILGCGTSQYHKQ